jgi:hypothetical protein
MIRSLPLKFFLLPIVGLVAAVWAMSATSVDSDHYVSSTPSVSQRFVSIADEESLLDLCYRLKSLAGITGVSYREYSPETGSAIVTVFYNPRMASPQAIRVFMQYPYVLWNKPSRT